MRLVQVVLEKVLEQALEQPKNDFRSGKKSRSAQLILIHTNANIPLRFMDWPVQLEGNVYFAFSLMCNLLLVIPLNTKLALSSVEKHRTR